VDNENDRFNGTLTLVPTNAATEANSLTITYVSPGSYTVHDGTTDIVLDATCDGCSYPNPADHKTAIVLTYVGVNAETGDLDSSIVVTGQETLSGSYNNVLRGGPGKDTLTTTFLTSTLVGNEGADTLTGGPQDDSLVGAAGDDTMNGGAGDDSFSSLAGDGADAINGGPGVDDMSFFSKGAAVTVTEDGVPNDGVAGEGDNVGGLESMFGSPFNDSFTMVGTTPGGELIGGLGDDVLNGSGASETLRGDEGDDVIRAGAGRDQLEGGLGKDTLIAGPGNDNLRPGAGDDTGDGGAGDDSFDALFDGDGADSFTGGSGTDFIDYGDADGPISLTQNGAPDDGSAGEGDNVAADIEGLQLTGDADTVVAGPANNFVYGNGGEDNIAGGAGNDTLRVCCATSDSVVFSGGDGNDLLQGGDGDDALDGGAGDDRLQGGGSGADTFAGGAGRDVVTFSDFFNGGGGVTMTPDGVADDGANGQGSNIGTDVENLIGSVGPDIINGRPGVRNRIDGFGGGDTINVASDPADRDAVFCHSAGSLTRGFGSVSGSNDTVTADVLDDVSDSGATACATIHRPKHPRAKILSHVVRSNGRVFTVSFHCLSAVPNCRVDAQVETAKGTVLDTGRTLIGSGKTGQIRFRLSPLSRAKIAAGKSVKQRVTAEVTDADGGTTTLGRTITVKPKT
jgi:Ca2+-binding RTX toxin-like protein